MEQFAPFLKYGIIGILLLIIVLILLIVLRALPTLLQRWSNGRQQHQTESAGSKSAAWWILEMARVHKEAQLPLVEVLIRVERALVDALKNQNEMLYLIRQVRADQRRRAQDKESGDL